jgi:hypothetical protein
MNFGYYSTPNYFKSQILKKIKSEETNCVKYSIFKAAETLS